MATTRILLADGKTKVEVNHSEGARMCAFMIKNRYRFPDKETVRAFNLGEMPEITPKRSFHRQSLVAQQRAA